MDGLAVNKAVALIDRRMRDDRELAHLRECLEREMSRVYMSPCVPEEKKKPYETYAAELIWRESVCESLE